MFAVPSCGDCQFVLPSCEGCIEDGEGFPGAEGRSMGLREVHLWLILVLQDLQAVKSIPGPAGRRDKHGRRQSSCRTCSCLKRSI